MSSRRLVSVKRTEDDIFEMIIVFMISTMMVILFMFQWRVAHAEVGTLTSPSIVQLANELNDATNQYRLLVLKEKELAERKNSSSVNENEGIFIPEVQQREIDAIRSAISKARDQLQKKRRSIQFMGASTMTEVETYRFKKLMLVPESDRLPDPTSAPQLSRRQVEEVARLDFPAGHIAVSKEGRIFLAPEYFDPKSFDHKNAIHVIELVKKPGAQGVDQNDFDFRPFPKAELQGKLQSVHAIRIDDNGWLWILDHGLIGAPLIGHPQIMAVEMATGKVVFHHEFSNKDAPFGSFLNDMFIVTDGPRSGDVIIGDTAPVFSAVPGFIRLRYIVEGIDGESYVATQRLLNGHFSVMPSPFIRHFYSDHKDGDREKIWMKEVGPVSIGYMRNGIDGLTLDRKNGVVYYGAANRGELFKIGLKKLLQGEDVEKHVERVAMSTIVDGFTSDFGGNIYITDEAHDAILRYNVERKSLVTMVKGPQFAWPVSLAMGPGGDVYFTCYQLPDLIYKNSKEIKAMGPYPIYRFKSDTLGPVGH